METPLVRPARRWSVVSILATSSGVTRSARLVDAFFLDLVLDAMLNAYNGLPKRVNIFCSPDVVLMYSGCVRSGFGRPEQKSNNK